MWLIRAAYLVALSLTLAGLVHIGSLLGVPRVATLGPYDRLAKLDADGRFVVLPDEGDAADLLPFRDPAFVTAACRFDVSAGPVTLRAVLPSTYGAVAVHNRGGLPIYALNDRAAAEGAVELTILASDDIPAAELEEPSEERPALRIVSPTMTGFILVRLFAPAESARPALRALASKATCGRAEPRKAGS